MMKDILFIIIFSFSTISIKTQEVNMTYSKMVCDFELLLNVIKDVDPNIAIIDSVTGVSIMKDIDELKENITPFTTFEEFYYIVCNAISLTKNMHNEFDYYPNCIQDIPKASVEITDYCLYSFDKISPSDAFEVIYLDGNYYSANTHTVDGVINIPAGSRIEKISHIPVDEYVNKYNIKIDNSIKWDKYTRTYYTNRIFSPSILGICEFFDIEFEYNNIHSIKKYLVGEVKGWSSIDIFKHKVIFFDELNILYIRIPNMDYGQVNFYKKEIELYKNKEIDKVIIDIRGNRGGNDLLWENLLSCISDRDIELKSKICYNNTDIVKSQLCTTLGLTREHIESLSHINICKNSMFCIEEDYTIAKDNNSLNYSGCIYILVDEYCFSSSLALTSISDQVDKMKTVGKSSNVICGRGVTPFHFYLPNSRLIFKISPALDCTRIVNIEDFYNNKIDIPVLLSIEDYLRERNYKGDRYGKEYLLKYDPFFRAIINNQQ